MADHIEQFGLYTAKIFELLYDSFPVPLTLNKNNIISEYLMFNQDDELMYLKSKKVFADSPEYLSNDEELKQKAKLAAPSIESKIESLEKEKLVDRNRQQQIYEGTKEFLISENFIRECKDGEYQLTSKAFSHLNKIFKEGSLDDDRKTYISVIKDIFAKSSAASLKAAMDMAVSVVTSLLQAQFAG